MTKSAEPTEPAMPPKQALYRAYRPQTFDAVIGQPEIVSTLEAQIARGTPAHAYLFAGSRGLGKTSVARIFARALGTSTKDLYELDAASNNSVDDMRALTESSYTLPFESPYKVFILDEVHMLSRSAWNAFLKTLEEPPPHAIFILATTERHKVPDTAESRCQTLVFRKPRQADLAMLIERVAKQEGFVIYPDAVALIATLAENSYRDALSILGRVRAATAGNEAVGGGAPPITREIAERATGAPPHELVATFIEGIAHKNTEQAIGALMRAAHEGVSMQAFHAFALALVRTALLAQYAPKAHAESHSTADTGTQLSPELAERVTPEMLVTLLDAHDRLGYAPVPELALELVVYELC